MTVTSPPFLWVIVFFDSHIYKNVPPHVCAWAKAEVGVRNSASFPTLAMSFDFNSFGGKMHSEKDEGKSTTDEMRRVAARIALAATPTRGERGIHPCIQSWRWWGGHSWH
jgi:hypothetical protein